METPTVTDLAGTPVAEWPEGWDEAEELRWEMDAILVDGHRAEKWRPDEDDSARHLYRFAPPEGHPWHGKDVLMKICPTGGFPKYAQGLTESAIWNSMDIEDRGYFAEVLAAGGDPMTWDWCAQVFYPDLSAEHMRCMYDSVVLPGYEAKAELVDMLAAKYDLTDWTCRQWKLRPDGTPLIHDYGISPAYQPDGPIDDED